MKNSQENSQENTCVRTSFLYSISVKYLWCLLLSFPCCHMDKLWEQDPEEIPSKPWLFNRKNSRLTHTLPCHKVVYVLPLGNLLYLRQQQQNLCQRPLFDIYTKATQS